MERTIHKRQKFGLPDIGIPAEILFNQELSMTEKIIFGFVRNLAHSEDGCWATNQYLGNLIGVKPQTITNAITKLQEYHYIEVSYEKRNNGMQIRRIFINRGYPLIYEEYLKEVYKNFNTPLLKNLYPPIKNLIPPYKNFNSKKDKEKVNEKEKDIIPPSKFNPPEKPKKKNAQERTKGFLPLARYLAKVIKSKKNIQFPADQIQSWAREIRILSEENKIPVPRIKEALKWYHDNIGGEYIPVIESGSSLRSKFLKLEAAIARSNETNRYKTPKPNTTSSGSRAASSHDENDRNHFEELYRDDFIQMPDGTFAEIIHGKGNTPTVYKLSTGKTITPAEYHQLLTESEKEI